MGGTQWGRMPAWAGAGDGRGATQVVAHPAGALQSLTAAQVQLVRSRHVPEGAHAGTAAIAHLRLRCVHPVAVPRCLSPARRHWPAASGAGQWLALLQVARRRPSARAWGAGSAAAQALGTPKVLVDLHRAATAAPVADGRRCPLRRGPPAQRPRPMGKG